MMFGFVAALVGVALLGTLNLVAARERGAHDTRGERT
jgi:hypothetical protein